MIPYGRQEITDADIEAVTRVLKSDFITQGPEIPRFEAALADKTGAAHVVACHSATAGLHLAYRALGVGPGDTVWTSPITFVATANAARMCGADVDFVDIDADTQCMDIDLLTDKLQRARSEDRLPQVVAPVHFAGRSCDMAAIGALASEFGFYVVEDAAHAVGARYGNNAVGACPHSDVAVFSFHPVKIVTTGEGGAAATNDAEVAERMRLFCSHGITRDPALMHSDSEGDWYYQQIDLGYNYRMTDIQAALGTSQLDRLEPYVARRQELVRRYDRLLEGLPVSRPPAADVELPSWHLYPIRLQGDRPDRRAVFDALRARGIGVQVHYIPVHLQPYYRHRGFGHGDYPVAEDYYARAISLPLFATLTDAEQDTVVEILGDILKAA